MCVHSLDELGVDVAWADSLLVSQSSDEYIVFTSDLNLIISDSYLLSREQFHQIH